MAKVLQFKPRELQRRYTVTLDGANTKIEEREVLESEPYELFEHTDRQLAYSTAENHLRLEIESLQKTLKHLIHCKTTGK